MNKYEDIAKIIENKILDLEYTQGEKLPSIRNIMKQYHCSVSVKW